MVQRLRAGHRRGSLRPAGACLVVAMYGSLPEAADVHVTRPAPSLSFATILILTVLTLGVVWLGLFPAPLIHTIRLTVASLL